MFLKSRFQLTRDRRTLKSRVLEVVRAEFDQKAIMSIVGRAMKKFFGSLITNKNKRRNSKLVYHDFPCVEMDFIINSVYV